MKLINFNNLSFYKNLKNHLESKRQNISFKIDNEVLKIINDVKKNGDNALIKYTKKFDKIHLSQKQLLFKNSKKSYNKNYIEKKVLVSFKKAINNITKFHKKQIPNDYKQVNNGAKLRSVWKPIESVGLYVPGGMASYPSSLIMNVVPAKVAGVKRIVCVTPPMKKINYYLLALFKQLKINEIYFVGGPQAIAALAYGTKTIKPVDKIFGPGNAYVASAKKQVFGKVGIDLIAGPSEIIVVANEYNNPIWVASDLMAQAEHDINSKSILITNSRKFANDVLNHINILCNNLQKKDIITKSLKKNGMIIFVDDIIKSSEIINYIAPEHLHIQVKEKYQILKKIRNAGCTFIGEYTSEAFGDYIVGTNHILPTSGAAKFSSGLGVLDFMKRNSIVEMNKKSFDILAKDAIKIADAEGLDAHKLSVKIRQTKHN